MLPVLFLLLEPAILFLLRVHFYLYSGYADPISLWGRIRTLRWIVPGYDQVFLVAAPASGWPLPRSLLPAWAGGVPLEIALPLAISMVCLVALDHSAGL